ncbi:molybdopterin molybdenumtransferase MoeA, partial [Burkholderia gladioli]
MSTPAPQAPRPPMLSTADALAALLGAAVPLAGSETVPTLDALGRVLAADVVSPLDVPPMAISAMDGYAVRVADLTRGERRLPVSQRIPAGHAAEPLAAGT